MRTLGGEGEGFGGSPGGPTCGELHCLSLLLNFHCRVSEMATSTLTMATPTGLGASEYIEQQNWSACQRNVANNPP